MTDWIKTLNNVIFRCPKDKVTMSIKDVNEIRSELVKLTKDVEYRKKEIARLKAENMRLTGKTIELAEANEAIDIYKINEVV